MDSKIARLRQIYRDRTPVVITKYRPAQNESVKEFKYLVPNTLTAAEMLYILRKKNSLLDSEALFLFHKSRSLCGTDCLQRLDAQRVSDADPLRLTYGVENCFG